MFPRVTVFVDSIRELPAESVSDSEDEEAPNIFNALPCVFTNFHLGGRPEAMLTEEELGRVGLCCHFALDCLCETWNMF